LTEAEGGGKALAPGRRWTYAQAPSNSEAAAVKAMSTTEEKEIARGRSPLWLDPDDLRFIACEYSRLAEDAPEELNRVWMRIAARAHAALQKSGHPVSPFQCSGGGAAED
jgi:hypothetical protein